MFDYVVAGKAVLEFIASFLTCVVALLTLYGWYKKHDPHRKSSAAPGDSMLRSQQTEDSNNKSNRGSFHSQWLRAVLSTLLPFGGILVASLIFALVVKAVAQRFELTESDALVAVIFFGIPVLLFILGLVESSSEAGPVRAINAGPSSANQGIKQSGPGAPKPPPIPPMEEAHERERERAQRLRPPGIDLGKHFRIAERIDSVEQQHLDALQLGEDVAHETRWYIAREGKQYGPLNTAELRKFAVTRRGKVEDLVWRYGFSEWRPISRVLRLTQT